VTTWVTLSSSAVTVTSGAARPPSPVDAKERSEAKMRQFVSDASHELRTPLATVRGYAEL